MTTFGLGESVQIDHSPEETRKFDPCGSHAHLSLPDHEEWNAMFGGKDMSNDSLRERVARKAVPQTSTIRVVSGPDVQSQQSEDNDGVQDTEHLVPAMSRMDLGDDSHSAVANGGSSRPGSHLMAPEAGYLDLDQFRNSNQFSWTTAQVESPRRTPDPHASPHIKKSSLDKPLPPPPSDLPDANVIGGRSKEDARNLERELGVSNVLDLSNTEDTDFQQRWAPAVTHETITKDVHEIREERITREIHKDHVFHRVLPIEQIEVKPARHYVYTHGAQLAEIPESRIPGPASRFNQQLYLNKPLPESDSKFAPRKFTARTFKGTEGEYTESTAPEGHKMTEQYWVHGPSLETHAPASGQTLPFHFNSPNPADDGLRVGI